MVLVKAMTNSTCKTNEYGTKRWYNDKGKLHRENGLPAIEWANGDKEWFLNGKLHRENGPAVESANGTKNGGLMVNELTARTMIHSYDL